MNTNSAINLGFVIKNRAYREALVYAMQSRHGFAINQQTYTIAQNEEDIGNRTDVLVCDEHIDCLLTYLHRLRDRERYPKFILVLHSLDNHHVDKYISTGIHGFISFDEGLDKLEECITEVHAGRLYYPSEITQRFLNTLTGSVRYHTNIRGDSVQLTPRQISVIKLIESGCSNKDIARNLGIELATVKNHVHVILEKLHAKNRNEAVAVYRKSPAYKNNDFINAQNLA